MLSPPRAYLSLDWIDQQKFPLIHQIIFGRVEKSLADELADNPGAVHEKDAMGRTALDWATARAQLTDMTLLIKHGSEVNTMDKEGRTTILHAVDSHNHDAVRIILEAGGKPNPIVPPGLHRSSPLIAASTGCLKETMELLLEHGAKVDACNPEGRTALQAVAIASATQSGTCANILLSHGADPYDISRNGHSALTMAIIYNNHAVLKAFIERCDARPGQGLHLLSHIATSADADTMSILAGSDLFKQGEYNADCSENLRDAVQQRTDYDERLNSVFEELLGQVRVLRKPSAG